MESKTLRVIQVFSKIGRILSKIIEICCIVGTIGCIIGIVSIAVCGTTSFKVGNITIHNLIENSANLSIGTIYTSMTIGLILCIAEGVIAKLAGKYFKNELIAGTPFTFDGAKEMLRLGICIMAITVGAICLCGIAYAIMNNRFADVADMHIDDFSQVGIGLAFLLVSFICKYGAEKETAIAKQESQINEN